jgi:hypothetical protein
MKNVINKIKVFETGSICIDLNKPIQTEEEINYVINELNKIYNNQNGKRTRQNNSKLHNRT